MCGIAGFLSHDPKRPADMAVVSRLMAGLVHRGPDDHGSRALGPCGLGHRRLSIIDLSERARQPLASCDGRSAVVVNGEFYDFEEARSRLRPDHRFVSSSDSELAVHLYEERGEDFVAALNGMFALALWDDARQRLILARDRTGKKPLYTRRLEHGLAFASEIAPLAALAPTPSPRLASIDEYLSLAYVPAPFTAYEGIFKLPAASIAVITPGGEVISHPYYARSGGPELMGSAADLADELRSLLEASVKRRLRSDVPLGAFLSGGIDSSTIVSLMARSSRVKTFSVGFRFGDRVDDSELRHAREVARKYDTEHHEEIVSPNVTELLPEVVARHGEPFGDSSALAMHVLSKVTRSHVTVALSGDGADELLAGYKRHGLARLGAWHDDLPAVLRGPLAAAIRRVGTRSQSVGPFAAALGDGEAARYLSLFGNFTPKEKAALYGDAMASVDRSATQHRFESLLGHSPLPKRLSALDVATYLPDDINTKVDIASMTFGLEVRCPFLDTSILDFTGRLPARMLMRARGKYLLRRAVRDLVPAPIRHRVKRGFALPLEAWMRKDLRPLVRETFEGRALRELFRPEALRDLESSLDRPGAPVDRAWLVLVLGTWLSAFR